MPQPLKQPKFATPTQITCRVLIDTAIARVQSYLTWTHKTQSAASVAASDCLGQLNKISGELTKAQDDASTLLLLAEAGAALSLIGGDVVTALPDDQRAEAADTFRALAKMGGKTSTNLGRAESASPYVPAFREAAARARDTLAKRG